MFTQHITSIELVFLLPADDLEDLVSLGNSDYQSLEVELQEELNYLEYLLDTLDDGIRTLVRENSPSRRASV